MSWLTWVAKPIERWRLYCARKAYIATETKSLLDTLTGKLKYADNTKSQQELSLEDTTRIVAYHLARGANPNARFVLPVKSEVFTMGPYRTLKGNRSLLSESLQRPPIVEKLVDAGACFDQSALEVLIANYNWPYRKTRQYSHANHPAPHLSPALLESLDILVSKAKITANLGSYFLDLHDRQVRTASDILGRFHPGLQSLVQATDLDEATPQSNIVASRNRL